MRVDAQHGGQHVHVSPGVQGGRLPPCVRVCPKGPQHGPLPLPASPGSGASFPQSRVFIPAIALLHSLFKLYNFCLIVMAYFKITRNQSQEVDTRSFIASLR